MSSLKAYFLNLNLFKSVDDGNIQEDEHERHSNIIATRVYLVVLGLLLISVAILSGLSPETTSVIIREPTIDQYKTLPLYAQCSCSRISISYGEFISLQSRFHQVCSSDFVSDQWVQAINMDTISNSYISTDFRASGSAQFQALAGLCHLSISSVLRSITSFNTNTLISPKVLSETIVQSQTKASLDQFQSGAPTILRTLLDLIGQINKQFISALQRNFHMQYNTGDLESPMFIGSVTYEDIRGFTCDCFGTIDCQAIAGIYGNRSELLLMKVPGIVVGCLPVNSMLLSTLECLYNQTCIDTLMSYFNTNYTFTAMKLVDKSRYDADSVIKSIVDGLMVEEWLTDVSYSKYYNQCAPNSCSYSEVKRPGLLIVLTTLISLLGGLTLVLGLVIPVVTRVMRRPRNLAPTPKVPLRIRIRELIGVFRQVLRQLNLFKQHPSSDRQVHFQRIATRLYLCLTIGSLVVLTTYLLFSVRIHHDTIFNPTISQYNELEQKYPTSLSCPCSLITIPYTTFMTMQPHYHQVCSSDLVTAKWIIYNFLLDENVYVSNWDYRLYAGSHFETLAVCCQEAQLAIDSSLNNFLQIHFVSSQVVSRQVFESQLNSLISNWQLTTTNLLLRTMKLILATTQGNRLTSGHLNIEFKINVTSRQTTMIPRVYGNCSCALSHSCRKVLAIYDTDPTIEYYTPIFGIPNFFIGCYLIDSFLASTLECFYNRSCMMEIDQYMYLSLGEAYTFVPLDPNLNSPYDSIESMLDKLMVNSWSSNVSFTSYYKACAPLSCTFDNARRMDTFLVITTVIGTFGGLSLGFKILLVIILHLIPHTMTHVSCPALKHFIKNLFIHRDERQVTQQLHFVLVATTFCVVYAVTAFTPRLATVEVQKPSLSIYQDLLKRFPDTLQCPCSHISIKYESFITIEPRFHPVCSSDFVSDRWIAYLYGEGDLTERYAPSDFLYSASAQFQLLASFCRLSRETVIDTLRQLATSDFINANLLSIDALEERIRLSLIEFEATVPNLYVSTLSLIRETTGANMLLSALATNWIFDTPMAIVNEVNTHTKPLTYQNCSCGSSSKCVQSSRGMLAGCYALEALLQSTLGCFHDQDCIDPTHNFQAMHLSSSDMNYSGMNATIESIANQLMVEEYFSNISYGKYFYECAPSSCIYSYTDRTAVIDGITYLIGLYGGLMIVCRSIAVIIVKLMWHQTTKVIPISS